jgi:hypothetical protein
MDRRILNLESGVEAAFTGPENWRRESELTDNACAGVPSSAGERMRIGAHMQKAHSGCNVKYGATSQLAWNAASAVSKASV